MERLVSIVLPVYNGEKYLRESIESVIAQTYRSWELIIVDDCSQDSTPDIAKEYAEKDGRIKYFRNEENLRLPRNLNRGFSLAQGDYLTWTSDDNMYRPTAIERMAGELENNKDAQFVFASCRVIDADGKPFEYITVTQNSPSRLVGVNEVGACFMYTRRVYDEIGEYDPECILVEDFDYWQRICAKFKASGINEILYDYRMHDGALTGTMRKDTFNRNLENVLLKNRPGFGKITAEQKYFYYFGLSRCRDNLGEENPYKSKLRFYSVVRFWRIKVPNKIRRMLRSK